MTKTSSLSYISAIGIVTEIIRRQSGGLCGRKIEINLGVLGDIYIY